MKHILSVKGKLAAGTLLCLGLTGSAFSQTVTVDPTAASPDGETVFTSLQAAVRSFGTGGTNFTKTGDIVINVRNDHGAVVDKVFALSDDVDATPSPITIRGDMLIQGVDANNSPALAVFAGLPVSNEEQNIRNNTFSAFVWRQPVNLTIKNLAFIPAANSAGNPISSFMLLKATATAGVNPNVNLESCVFTANDGNNAPVTTTGRPEDDAKLDAPGVIGLYRILPTGGAAGIWAFSRQERGDYNLNIKDTVFASMATLTGTNPRTEVFKGWMSGNPLHMINFFINVNEGCVFANIDGNIAQIGWGGMIRMKGTDAKPVVVRKFKNPNPPAAIWLYYSTNSNQPVAGEFDHVHFFDIDIPIISEGGVLGDGSQSFINHINNCVFADSTDDAVTLRSKDVAENYDTVTGLAQNKVTIDGSVFHNVGSGTNPSGVYSTSAFTRNLDVVNSYFTDSDATMVGLNNNSATSIWTVDTTVLSKTAPTALRDATWGTGTINLGAGVSDGAVTYVNTTDPFSSDFYKPAAAVKDWSVY